MRKIFRKTVTLRQIIIWTIAITFALSGTVISYAEEYYDLRDGNIALTFPDGWECDEIDEDLSDDMESEQIAIARDNSGKSELSMNMYYADDDVVEYEWFYLGSDADEIMEYFDSYGKAAVERLYTERGFASVSIGEPGVFEGEYNNFLTVPVSTTAADGTAISDIVYLTCDMTNDGEEVIHQMLRFYNADGTAITESEVKDIGIIANDFYDYGYGDDSENYYNDDDYSSDFSEVFDIILGLIVMLIPLIIVVIVIVKIARKKKNAFLGTAGGSRKRSKDDFSVGFRKKRSDSDKGKFRRADEDNMQPNKHPHDHIRPSNAEERYMESLNSLRKSGLLTKEEMQDMLERHERNKMYKR